MRQSKRQCAHQALAANLYSPCQTCVITSVTPSYSARVRRSTSALTRRIGAEGLDRILVLVAILLAKLGLQPRFAFLAATLITLAQPFQMFCSIYLSLHSHLVFLGVIFP